MLLKTGKFYAKHSHIPEQTKMLSDKDPRVAVGAPARCSSLVSRGALKLDKLELVVIDMHRGGKNDDIFTQEGNRKDVMSFIYNDLLPNVESMTGKIMLF